MGRNYHFKFGYFTACFIIVAAISLWTGRGLCQAPHTSAQFLLIAPDARGAALGDGGSVFSKGAISPYYNPALLVTSKEISADYSYCQYLPSLADDLDFRNLFLSSSYRNEIYFGIGYSKLSYGRPEWEDEYGNSPGSDESYDAALVFSAAVSFDSNNSAGIGIKYIKSRLASFRSGQASSVALDLGILSGNQLSDATWISDQIFYPSLDRLFRPDRNRGFAIGISIANLGEGLSYYDSDDADPLPRRLRVGFGYQAVDSEPVGLQLTLDATKVLVGESEIAWSYGIEADLYYLFRFRLGKLADDDQRLRYNTIGFGIGPEWLCVDYTWILGDEDEWNRRAGEHPISVRCNISTETFSGD